MKLRLSIVCIVAALVNLSAIGQGYAQDKDKGGGEGITQLYNAAKKEGTVIIWGPTDAVVYQRMQEALDKQYPGIKIQSFESIPEPLVQRIIAESQAGKPAAVDVIQSGSLRALRPLIDRDMLAPFSGWEKDFGLDAVYANQRFVGGYNLTLPIAYNTKMVNAQEAPKTWEDLADPKWKGRKIIIEARLVPFAMLGTEWGKGKAVELTKKILSQQQPLIVQGGTTVANALAGGQVSLAVGTYAFTIEGLKKQGAAVDWVAVSPLPVLTSAEGVLKTAAHPNAGRFFAGWMGTPEGQKIRYASRGQAMEVGRNAIGNVAERIRTQKPAIILETDKTFASILEIQRELGKLLGALR
ncbi:MAG TPA: extracellular solute-binding protein [Candidatus Saccharimonadales bacterium]|nr:extracellular solute-binding protein [Candidatus Saccharimonadales bacterium]